MEDNINDSGFKTCGCGGGYCSGFGWILVILGGFFVIQDLGWVPSAVSFWPVVFIALGIYFIIKKSRK